MKVLYVFLICLSFPFFAQAQINFEKGYYINNLDQREVGLIKNMDWKSNPSEFEFKATESAEPKTITLKYAKEFGFEEGSKYLKATVNLDRSTGSLAQLGSERSPQMVEEEVFLKVLVEGEAILYRFEDGNLTRYFYKKNESSIIPLIYKEYLDENKDIKKNEAYKQELYTNLKCPSISLTDIENLRYIRTSLEGVIVKYNSCIDPGFSNTISKKDHKFFHLNIRPGIKNASLDYERFSTIGLPSTQVSFENAWSFRAGLEAEFVLPFNKDKWAIILEPTYQNFKSEKEIDGDRYSADYKSIEVPIGLRHYFFLDDRSKLFLNMAFLLDFPVDNSNIIYKNRVQINVKSRNNFAVGAGFKYADKYSLEFRYDLDRNVLSDYVYYTSNYGGVSLIFGYTLF